MKEAHPSHPPTDLKEERRMAYKIPRQDHGTRGNSWSRHLYSIFVDRGEISLRQEPAPDFDEEGMEAVEAANRRLAALSDEVMDGLHNSGLWEDIPQVGNTGSSTSPTEPLSTPERYEGEGFSDPDLWADLYSDEPIHVDPRFKAEILGAWEDARRRDVDPGYLYEGTWPENTGDPLFGFHITDRP